MNTFLLALLLDIVLLVFLTLTVWTVHGWFGVFMYAVSSMLANVLYYHARQQILLRRKLRRDPQPGS